jgi:MYXO-CTERM domain-containing protein
VTCNRPAVVAEASGVFIGERKRVGVGTGRDRNRDQRTVVRYLASKGSWATGGDSGDVPDRFLVGLAVLGLLFAYRQPHSLPAST